MTRQFIQLRALFASSFKAEHYKIEDCYRQSGFWGRGHCV